MVLETLNSYFDKVALALNCMAMFVVATGLMILTGALISGRYERLREAALLRTLGASSPVIRSIHLVEYALIGLTSGLFGLLVGGAGSFVTTKYVFKIAFDPGLAAIASGLGAMILISVGTGLFLGRGVLRAHPLDTLREEQ